MTIEAPQPHQTTDAMVTAHNLGFSVGNKVILSDISFSIVKKQITTIIGPNGAGKSTLVKIIAGLASPTSGALVKAPNCRLGYVPQKLQLNESMPIKVSRFMSLAGISRSERNQALDFLSINHLKSAQMHDLSGGELQRVLLARAISRNPDLLILDEPLQGVDVAGQIELYRLIADLRQTLDSAVLMVSHDLHLVMAQTDSVLCLNQHICCHGKPESVSQHPEYIKLFGAKAAQDIALYTHHHDHHHTIHGDPVDCNDHCKHV